jgi:hypothetical protein
MKNLIVRVGFLAALTGLAWLGTGTRACAQDRRDSAEQLERLERRVNELAERQEQFMKRIGPQLKHLDQMTPPGRADIRPPMPPPGAPMAGPHNPHAAKFARALHHAFGLLVLIGIICNILLAVWIFTDIRKRNEGSGIFVAMALVAGIPAALIYALTRIGDKKG